MDLSQLYRAALMAAVAACSPDARADLPDRVQVVDSVLPRDEAVRRFREGLPPVDSLSGGAASRDELVAAVLAAVGTADTGALDRLAVSRAEFAYLYYPTAREGKPPYDLEPGLMWFMQYERSNQGVQKALARYGKRPMTLVGYDCGSGSQREGENTIYGPCVVRWESVAGDTVADRLFSKILERDGRFKILSYANRLD